MNPRRFSPALAVLALFTGCAAEDSNIAGEVGALSTAPAACFEQQILSSGVFDDSFGDAMSMDGTKALIGAPQDQAAYVYVRSGETWALEAKLTTTDPPHGGYRFGDAVALSGDTALVAEPTWGVEGGTSHGAVYVFELEAGTWTEKKRLMATDSSRAYGTDVAIEGNLAVIGSPGAYDSLVGAVEIWERDTAGEWQYSAQINANDYAVGDRFGITTELSGDTIAVGALGVHAHYVFVRNGAQWNQEAKLDGGTDDTLRFGGILALDGNTIMLGAPRDNSRASVAGAALVYTRSGQTWSGPQKLFATDAGQDWLFGTSVAVDGDLAVVGAIGPGNGYAFRRLGGNWIELGGLADSANQGAGALGHAVGILDNHALVSASTEGLGNPELGSKTHAYTVAERAAGDACECHAECDSGNCVDGVCCEGVCGDGGAGGSAGSSSGGAPSGGTAGAGAIGGMGAAPAAAGGPNDSGCGCRVASKSNGRSAWVALLLGVLALALRRRLFVVAASTSLACSPQLESERIENTSAPLVWGSQAKLAPIGASTFDGFGESVGLDGTTAIAGANGSGTWGRAFVFVRNGVTWTEQQALEASDVVFDGESHYFGRTSAISGDTAVVGAPGVGDAYVFVRSGTTWTEQQKLSGVGASALALDGDTLVIGAGTSGAGVVFVYVRSGNVWTEQQVLYGTGAEHFGRSVAVDGNRLLVGAQTADTNLPDTGAAYVYERVGTTWTLDQKLAALDATEDDWFGMAVALDGSTAVIAAPANNNAVYAFIESGGSWSQQQKLDTSAGSDPFDGFSVAVSGDTLLAGAPGAGTSNTGAAYVYSRSAGVWTLGQTLVALDASTTDEFGGAVSLQGSTAVIGAHRADGNAPGAGAMYVFAFGGEPGDACTQPTDCASGFCSGGVCCDKSCTGDCEACGSDGLCQPVGGTECRASAGGCDPAESCDGFSGDCPPDLFALPGTECRASASVCDAPETCTGSSASCPVDAQSPDGAACDDGDSCQIGDVCQGGACIGGDPNACASTGTGGTVGTGGATGGAAPAAPSATESDSGCGCRTRGSGRGTGFLSMVLVFALAAGRRYSAHSPARQAPP